MLNSFDNYIKVILNALKLSAHLHKVDYKFIVQGSVKTPPPPNIIIFSLSLHVEKKESILQFLSVVWQYTCRWNNNCKFKYFKIVYFYDHVPSILVFRWSYLDLNKKGHCAVLTCSDFIILMINWGLFFCA